MENLPMATRENVEKHVKHVIQARSTNEKLDHLAFALEELSSLIDDLKRKVDTLGH